MSNFVLSAELRATDKGLVIALNKGQQAALGLGKASRRAKGSLGELNREAGSSGRIFAGLKQAIIGVGLIELSRRAFASALSFDAMKEALKGATGSAAAGAEAFDYVSAEADRLGLSVKALSSGYAQLTAASRGTALEGQATRDIFAAINESAVVMKLSSDTTAGALRAVQQMMSKGSVQAEELRGQLGERLPGAFQIAARAMGKTTAELSKMLENGEVLAADFLPKFAEELKKTFGGGLADAVKSTQAELARLGNAATRALDSFSAGGALDGAANVFRSLTAALNDPAILAGLSAFGSAVGRVFTELAEHGSLVVGTLAGMASARILAGLGAVAVAVTRIKQAVIGLTVAMMANPLGLLVVGVSAAVSAAVGAFVAFRDELVTIKGQTASVADFAIAAFVRVREGVGAAIKGLAKPFADFRDFVVSVFGDISEAIKKTFGPEVIQGVSEFWEGLMQAPRANVLGHVFDGSGTIASKPDAGIIDEIAARARRRYASRWGDDDMTSLDYSQYIASTRKEPVPSAPAPSKGLIKADKIASDLEMQRKGLARLVEARIAGTSAVREALIAQAQDQALRRAGLEITAQSSAAERGRAETIRKLVAEIYDLKAADEAAQDKAKRHAETTAEIGDALLALKPAWEQSAAAAKKWREEALAGLDQTKAGYEDFRRQIEEIYQGQMKEAHEEALQSSTRWEAGATRAMRQIAEESGNVGKQIEGSLTKAFKASEDAFVGFVQTGKLSFADLANSMIADMIRITVQKQITAPITESLGGFFGGMFGGAGGGAAAGGYTVTALHTGGVVGRDTPLQRQVSPAVFAAADRYHGGGQVGGRREVPIIALEGERVLTEAQQANTASTLRALASLAHRQTERGAVTVNIHNRTDGTRATAQERRGAGGEVEIDVLIEQIEGAMTDNIERGEGLAPILEGRYDLARATGR